MSDLPDQVHQATIDTIERVRLEERERIIKLLEEYDFSTIWRQIEWFPPAWESFGSEELIELIKGETK